MTNAEKLAYEILDSLLLQGFKITITGWDCSAKYKRKPDSDHFIRFYISGNVSFPDKPLSITTFKVSS